MTTSPYAGLEGLVASDWLTYVLASSPALQAAVDDLGLTLPNGWAAEDALYASIHEGVAPPDAPLPWWITFTILDPMDVKVVSLIQVMAMVEVQVKVTTDAASYQTLRAPFVAIHQTLEGVTNADAGTGTILTCERVSARQYPETANGVEYRHLGGLYRAYVQVSPTGNL